jgi:ubiquinone/menaquinone biosynthesis C-methylase UbiE
VLARIQRLVEHVLVSVLDRLSTPALEALVFRTVSDRMSKLPADEALRFLFRLESFLYVKQGQKSIEYGGGIHTKHRHTRYHDFFVSRIQVGERVLDIGCGIGALAYDVAEKSGAYVLGIDINAENITQARARYPHPRISFHVVDAMEEIPDGAYDVVILSNVLEHLRGRSDFLIRVQRLVKPSRFLIRAPLFERDWRVPLKKELGVEWRLDSSHEIEYTLEAFANELAEAKLKIGYQEVRWGEIWAEAVLHEQT